MELQVCRAAGRHGVYAYHLINQTAEFLLSIIIIGHIVQVIQLTWMSLKTAVFRYSINANLLPFSSEPRASTSPTGSIAYTISLKYLILAYSSC